MSSLIPHITYVPGRTSAMDIEMNTESGGVLLLERTQTLGEEIVFKCYEKQTKLFRGFIVRNIKYGFFGDICDDVKKAIDSADQKWFDAMGIHRMQKQK